MDQLDEWEKNFINMPVSEMFPLLIAGKELTLEFRFCNSCCRLELLKVALIQKVKENFQIALDSKNPEHSVGKLSIVIFFAFTGFQLAIHWIFFYLTQHLKIFYHCCVKEVMFQDSFRHPFWALKNPPVLSDFKPPLWRCQTCMSIVLTFHCIDGAANGVDPSQPLSRLPSLSFTFLQK